MNSKPSQILKVTLLASAITGTMPPSQVHAAIIALDGFDSYPQNAALSGNNSGTGWAAGAPGAWQAPGANITATVVPGTMTAAGITGGSSAVEVSGSGNIAGARLLGTTLTETFYAGALIRLNTGVWDGSNTFSIYASNSATNTTGALSFGIRNSTAVGDPSNPGTAGGGHFMLRTATGSPPGTAAVIPGSVVTGTDYYLVARYNWSGTNFDSIDLWLNPMGDPTLPSASMSIAAGTGLTSITHLFGRAAVLQTTGSVDTVWFDQLAVGTAWKDVVAVPEPTAGLLAFFAASTLIFPRRKRS